MRCIQSYPTVSVCVKRTLFTWRIAVAVIPSVPVPALTPPSLPGVASHSPVADVALPLARGSAFLAADMRKHPDH